MTTTDALALAAFILAVINFAWSIWTHVDQTRDKLKHFTEVVHAGTRSSLVVYLANVGRSPVFINNVVLEGVATRYVWAFTPERSQPPLAPGEGREYRLDRSKSLIALGDIRNARRYQVWVSVNAPRGELLKINDATFLAHLKEFAGVTARQRKAAPRGPTRGHKECHGRAEGEAARAV